MERSVRHVLLIVNMLKPDAVSMVDTIENAALRDGHNSLSFEIQR
jgi:hypothetical protein